MLKLDRTHQLKKPNGLSLMEATQALTSFGEEAEGSMECVTHDFALSYQAIGTSEAGSNILCTLTVCHTSKTIGLTVGNYFFTTTYKNEYSQKRR